MQHALEHVERPGGSHTAFDGKKNVFSQSGERVVIFLLHWNLRVVFRKGQVRNQSWEGRNLSASLESEGRNREVGGS